MTGTGYRAIRSNGGETTAVKTTKLEKKMNISTEKRGQRRQPIVGFT